MTQEPLTQELTKANITEALVADLKEEAEIKLAEDIKDDAEAKLVDGLRKRAKYMRIGGEKAFDHEIAERHRLHKEAIAQRNKVLKPIIDVEERAEARLFVWKHEQEKIAKEKEEARRAELEARNNACLEMGFQLKDGVWSLEGMNVDAEDVLKADHEKWGNLQRSMQVIAAEVAERREKERLLAEENARRAKEIEDREAALRLQEQQMRERVNEARRNELLAIGYTSHDSVVLHALDEEGWQHYLHGARMIVAEQRQQELVEHRAKALKEAGWVETELGVITLITPEQEDSIQIGSVYQKADETFSIMLERGHAELARRKQAEEAAIAAKAIEEDRLRREAAEAEALRKAQEEEQARILRDGDKEFIRQALVAVENAGKHISPMIAQAKSDNGKSALSIARDGLLEIHRTLTRMQ